VIYLTHLPVSPLVEGGAIDRTLPRIKKHVRLEDSPPHNDVEVDNEAQSKRDGKMNFVSILIEILLFEGVTKRSLILPPFCFLAFVGSKISIWTAHIKIKKVFRLDADYMGFIKDSSDDEDISA
jgi:hypothetical protein